MTIAAAYRIEGRPVVFADMLLTTPKRPGRDSPLVPTQPYAGSVLASIGRASAGATRKALIINDRMAVAWSGNFASAKQVVRRLRAIVSGAPSIPEIAGVLGDFDEIPPDQFCRFVGWILDEQDVCFSWDSRNPNSIDVDDQFIGGSGSGIFQDILSSPSISGASPLLVGEELVAYKLACAIGQCLKRDWLDSSTSLNGFGFWYEAIFVDDGGKFRYVESVLFSAWAIDFDKTGKVNLFARPTILVQSLSGVQDVLVQTSWLPAQTGAESETYISVISDRTDENGDVDLKKLRKRRIKRLARYKCWSIELRAANHPPARLMLVNGPEDQQVLANMTPNGGLDLRIDTAAIYEMYLLALRSHADR